MQLALDAAPVGVPLVLAEVGGDPALRRRLAELGLRVGAPVRVAHRTAGGGRLVEVAGTRIALGRTLLAALRVTRAPAA